MSDLDPYDVLREDPVLDRLVDEHGELTVEPHDDPFRRVVTSIVNQQLSTQSAAAIRDRLFDRVELTPDALLAADDETLQDAGLSTQKIRYLRNVAESWDDVFDPRLHAGVPDEEVTAKLTDVTGIGDWTAKMYLLFVLGREDVFPVEDLGVRRGVEQLYADGEDLTRGEMREVAERWRPYRSYATRHIWAGYES